MINVRSIICAAMLAAVCAAPVHAVPIPVRDGGTLEVGVPVINEGFFGMCGYELYAIRFTIDVDVTQGSGYGLQLDSFGSFDLGSDTELALYTGDGLQILAINDDYVDGGLLDAYLAAGDAPQPGAPFNGTTRQGNITNEINLLAGTYLVVLGPFDTTWDSFDAEDAEVDNLQGGGHWIGTLLLYAIPGPSSIALLGMGTIALGLRRRHA